MKALSAEFEPVFAGLRAMLQKHCQALTVSRDTTGHYCLEAPVGPATLQAWRGKAKTASIPVAWVQAGKAYVSYHLMGVCCDPKLLDGCSKGLKVRMQGKSCFNFKVVDDRLFEELERLTAKSLKAMRKAGFISET